MSLFTLTLIIGILLLALGLVLLGNHSIVVSLLKGFPRSTTATVLLFGSASLWFLYRIWHLSPADFGEFRGILFLFFALVAALSFHYVPDFLAVRGLAALVLLTAGPVLAVPFGHYELPQRLALVSLVYALIVAALWLGAQPYRMRDFLGWMYAAGQPRARLVGGLLAGYGTLLVAIAFTY